MFESEPENSNKGSELVPRSNQATKQEYESCGGLVGDGFLSILNA